MTKYTINNLGIAALAGLSKTDREFPNRDHEALIAAINDLLADAGLVDHMIDMEQAGAARDVIGYQPLQRTDRNWWKDYDVGRTLGKIQSATAAFWEMVTEVA